MTINIKNDIKIRPAYANSVKFVQLKVAQCHEILGEQEDTIYNKL